MKKILTICVFVATAFSFAGCLGAPLLIATNHNLTQTQVVLSENNFKVVGQAYGEVEARYFLGLCATSRKQLRNNAINEMVKNANLTGAQALTNVTVSESFYMLLPGFMEGTYSATANIIEFK